LTQNNDAVEENCSVLDTQNQRRDAEPDHKFSFSNDFNYPNSTRQELPGTQPCHGQEYSFVAERKLNINQRNKLCQRP